jgi:hypothetical protein
MEAEIEGAVVHGEIKVYHCANVHTDTHDIVSFERGRGR